MDNTKKGRTQQNTPSCQYLLNPPRDFFNSDDKTVPTSCTSSTGRLSSGSDEDSQNRNEKYHVSGDFKEYETPPGYEKIKPPKKEKLVRMIMQTVTDNVRPDIEIRIGENAFKCHVSVLRCYSSFFNKEVKQENLIYFPEENIAPRGFELVYQWMLAQTPILNRKGLLDVFNAAKYLGIRSLENQCWVAFDDNARFCEANAFMLYMEAGMYDMEYLQLLMVPRICRFFLTFVATQQFVQMDSKEVSLWLSSNTIGVNSEMEVFMCAIRWLSHNWRNRKCETIKLMRCVRFGLLPAYFVVMLRNAKNCKPILRVIKHKEVSDMIDFAISYNTILAFPSMSDQMFKSLLLRYKLTQPAQRAWVYDSNCPYHSYPGHPRQEDVTYEDFLEYLDVLRKGGNNYWKRVCLIESAETVIGKECV